MVLKGIRKSKAHHHHHNHRRLSSRLKVGDRWRILSTTVGHVLS